MALAGCSGNRPVTRGYDSRELLPIRSTSLSLGGSNGPGVVVFQSSDGDGGVSYWSLDLTTGAAQDWGSTYPPPPGSPPPPPPDPPYQCSTVLGADGAAYPTLGIGPSDFDLTAEIPNVVSYAQCPGADQKLTAFVQDASGNDVLMTGPFTDLQQVSLPIDVNQVGWWTYDQTNAPATVTVWGTTAAAPQQIGFYSVDLGSYAVSTEIPAVPASAAWAPGAASAGSLESTSLAPDTLSVVQVGSADAPYFLYPRSMSDGGTTMFAGPFSSDTASELALFRVPAGTSVPAPTAVATTLGGAPTLINWEIDGPGTGAQLVFWNDATRRVTTCPSEPNAFLAGQVSPDGTKTLFVTPQAASGQYQGSGPLVLLTSGTGPGGSDVCTVVASEDVVTAGFSPDSAFLYWLVQPPAGPEALWVAASDGSGAHQVGTGLLQSVHFISSGGAQLEMILGGDLVWMDLHDAAVNLHYVAQQVFDLIFDVRGGWLIAGYDYSSQDTNGTLGLVNRNTGERRAISPQVQQFVVLLEGRSADGQFVSSGSDAAASTVLTVVYLVHGRNPSAQDGIWTATITAADLQ